METARVRFESKPLNSLQSTSIRRRRIDENEIWKREAKSVSKYTHTKVPPYTVD